MARGGLSENPDARSKQLDALKRGRQTQARRLLDSDSDSNPAPEDGGAAPPADPPAKRSPAKRKRKGSYQEKPKQQRKAGNAPRKKQSGKRRAKPAEPERPPAKRGRFSDLAEGLRRGFGS